ncbi:MAG TPA: protease modulator HflC [Gammaproteobacteria bacterium]|nr:protease modulator HflC [Gammaproteobacteria bacterium]
MSPRMSFSLIVIVAVAIVVGMSVFVVDEREHALKFQLGEIVRSDYEPGLHFKWPLVQNVVKFPNRILNYEDSEERFLTGEQKNLVVDYFVTWRVVDPAQYYVSVRADERAAVDRLAAVVKEGIKAAISQRDVRDVVSAERSELMNDMLTEVRSRSPELGIQVVDVRVKRIDLETEVSESVYARMRQERSRTAEELRAEGNEEAERISADADRQRTVILADARREAEIIRGAGDATASNTYAQAYSADPDFYAFYRSMTAYRQSIGGPQDVLVLQPDSEFFRYLQSQFGAEVLAN